MALLREGNLTDIPMSHTRVSVCQSWWMAGVLKTYIDSIKGVGNFARLRQWVLRLMPISLLAWLMALPLAPMAPDLSASDPSRVSRLLEQWRSGEVIVLVRHLERCSRVEAACLGPPTGITARSVEVAAELADEFQQLGLDSADIFNSPLTRTAQTARLLFEQSQVQDWLYQCRDNFLEDALRRKASGRNLVLVTHSSCMDESEQALQLADREFDYGTALFISARELERGRVLGFIDAADWQQVFGS